MNIELDIPPELASRLIAEAAELGLPWKQYALQLLARGRAADAAPKTGAELLEYWQHEGLVGTRPEISDSAAHARAIRSKAQIRTGS